MQIFLDSADLGEIQFALTRGIAGVTTNPSLVAKADGDESQYMRLSAIIDAMYQYDPETHLSIEPPTNDPDAIVRFAERIKANIPDHPGLTIKVPIGWDGLATIRELVSSGWNVNATACMTVNQALLAANAGADYVSIFWGRIQDIGQPSLAVVAAVRSIFDRERVRSEIIVGSIRSPIDVAEAFISGAHIVTVPYKLLEPMCNHPQTTAIVGQFLADSERGA